MIDKPNFGVITDQKPVGNRAKAAGMPGTISKLMPTTTSHMKMEASRHHQDAHHKKPVVHHDANAVKTPGWTHAVLIEAAERNKDFHAMH